MRGAMDRVAQHTSDGKKLGEFSMVGGWAGVAGGHWDPCVTLMEGAQLDLQHIGLPVLCDAWQSRHSRSMHDGARCSQVPLTQLPHSLCTRSGAMYHFTGVLQQYALPAFHRGYDARNRGGAQGLVGARPDQSHVSVSRSRVRLDRLWHQVGALASIVLGSCGFL